VWGLIWFFAKLMVFLFTLVWIRATLPRFRYDQLMNLGWKVMIPFALGWLLLLGAINIGRDEDWNLALIGGAGGVILVLGWMVLTAASSVAARRRLEEEQYT
jgi:NADH-quinone oxidoreductase subunit H